MLAPLLSLGLALQPLVAALRLPVVSQHQRLRRDSAVLYGESTLNNTNDIQYSTNITLGGVQWAVLIDTGSSDLWVAGTVSDSKNTGVTSGVQYAIGEVSGPVLTSTLEFAGHTVQNQAFLQIAPSSDNLEGTGLIGLGPNSGSNIFAAMGNVDSGAAVLDRIFRENTSTSNYITTLLGRFADTDEAFAAAGEITVGELVPGYEAVMSAPHLPVTRVSSFDTPDQHWQTLVDANGILINGKAIPNLVTGVNTTTNTAQLTAVFDSGFSIPQVPSLVAEAIYSAVSGASLQNIGGLGDIWTFPCDREINVTFTFAGKQIPIHPLDTSLDAGVSYNNGTKVCVGAFQPISTDSGGNYDLILGMAFLRNVYMLIDFGDFIHDDPSATADPYVQFLALTNDSSKAHSEFTKVRGASVSSPDGIHSAQSPVDKYKKWIILAVVLAVVFSVLSCCTRMFRQRRMRARQVIVVHQQPQTPGEGKWAGGPPQQAPLLYQPPPGSPYTAPPPAPGYPGQPQYNYPPPQGPPPPQPQY